MRRVRMSVKDPDNRPHDLFEPGYSFRDLGRDLLGGGLRWFATLLGFISGGYLAYCMVHPEGAELYWPIHLKGIPGLVFVITCFVAWTGIAVVNWHSWLRTRTPPKR